MKKKKILSLLAIMTLLGSIGNKVDSATKVNATNISGDLYGSARIEGLKQKDHDSGIVTEINANMQGNSDFSGTGIYLRMKNYTGTDTPLTFKINSTNGTLIAPTTNVAQTYFDINGNETTGCSPRGWGNYVMLPANFDGFIYMNYSTQMSKIEGASDFNPSSIWRIYIEFSGFYDCYAKYAIGDIFTDEKVVLDTSSVTEEDFSKVFINQNSEYQSITQNPRAESFVPKGDLLGGTKIVTTGYAGYLNKFGGSTDLSNGGVYFRIKNNLSTSSYLKSFLASDSFGNRAVTGPNKNYYKYDAAGMNETLASINEWGYFELPGNFDGFIYLPNESLIGDTNSGWCGPDYHSSLACAFYLEGDKIDISVGDIFSKDNIAFDGSSLYKSEIETRIETWGECTASILSGYKELEIPLFDYTTINYQGRISGGANITAKKNSDSSVFSSVTATYESPLDLSSGEAIAINYTGTGSCAFQLEFVDNASNVMQLPLKAEAVKKPIYLISNGESTAMNHTTGDENTIHAIEKTGVIVLQKDFLNQKAGTTFNWSSVVNLIIRVHTYYDYAINITFGDIGTVEQESLTHTVVFDCNNVNDIVETYHADDAYLTVAKYFIPSPSEWIGDVKIIDSLNYRTDEEMKKYVTYDIGDNACSYNKEDDGVFVHIGPYETGHQYGSYMCLGLFDHGLTTDRTKAYVEKENGKEYAKGITFYVENRSFKEIGITLQFDEKIPGKTTTERWCVVGYPAMYYAYDVEKDADYMMYSKSDQVQIPVGFKGYIRVPFESYSVPAWNAGFEGVDGILNLDYFSGNLFLTSDNTRFEDLEFFIKNVGLYFNETKKSSAFNTQNTIKENMGL